MSDISILIISNLFMFIGIVIIIAYLVRRDTLRQYITDTRYDSIISGLIQDITKNQATYKQEIVNEVKELTLATTNVLVGVERIVSGVEKVVASVNEVSNDVERFTDINTKSVTKVADNVEEVSTGVKEVSSGVKEVSVGVNRVVEEVDRVVCEVERVTKGLKELSDKMSNDIDNGNIVLNGKTVKDDEEK